MRTPGDAPERADTRPTTYAGGITIVAILLLIAIRMGIVKGGK